MREVENHTISGAEGIITKGVGGIYTVRLDTGDGETFERISCQIRGTFRNRGVTPQIGDRVVVGKSGDPDLPYVIDKILPRKNNLMRPPIANVDYLILTFSATNPEPDLTLLDKLLIICGNLDIVPIIVFTKEDLGEKEASDLALTYTEAGYKVFVSSNSKPVTQEDISSITGSGIAAFAGPSGVGKSTLCNSILGRNIMDVGEISERLKRGKHTTRHVELFDFGEGFITDTPGFTSLSLLNLDIDYRTVRLGYPEIMRYEGKCRFDDCRHISEAGCSVTDALSKGMISRSRYERYASFNEELYGERNNYHRRKV